MTGCVLSAINRVREQDYTLHDRSGRVAVGRMAALLAAQGCTDGGADEALELVAAFLLTDPTLPALRLSAV